MNTAVELWILHLKVMIMLPAREIALARNMQHTPSFVHLWKILFGGLAHGDHNVFRFSK